MRLFLLPISTRRTLIYCDRAAMQAAATTAAKTTSTTSTTSATTTTAPPPAQQWTLTYIHDRIINKANETWASMENSPTKWKIQLTTYGNKIFNRISYEEWGLKTLPSSSEPADLKRMEVLFPSRFLEQGKVMGELTRIATERQALHKKRFWGSLIGLPLTIPVGLLPVIPNIPGFYLAFRAWSHWKALYGSKHLEALINSKDSLLKLTPCKTLDNLYAAGLIHPSREHSRQAELPSDEASKEVAELVTVQNNKSSGEVMLLKRWNGKLLAESFDLPGMELEIERAVEQVESSIKADAELATEKAKAAIVSATETTPKKDGEKA